MFFFGFLFVVVAFFWLIFLVGGLAGGGEDFYWLAPLLYMLGAMLSSATMFWMGLITHLLKDIRGLLGGARSGEQTP